MRKKIISILLSILLILSVCPTAVFAAGETAPASSSGEWDYTTSKLNSDKTDFSTNGQNDISMAISDINFYFMQTVDDQVMQYSTVFYCHKNARFAKIFVVSLDTNLNDSAYSDVFINEAWDLTIGNVNDGGDSSPVGDELTGSWITDVTFTGYTYTASFTANGHAVYNPQWSISHKNRNTTFYTSDTGNPEFTIEVVDMRELLDVVDIAGQLNINISDLINGIDLTGSTYYSQSDVDDLVAAINARFVCDYSVLDAAITAAQAIDQSKYTPETAAMLVSALDAATQVARNLPATLSGENQQVIDAAATALADALNGLVPDKTMLQNKINEASAIDSSNYSAESYSDLVAAIMVGQSVLNNTSATITDIDAAIAAIDQAISDLVIDKANLSSVISDAENTDTTGMTPESVQALEDAIDAAKDVLNDPDATVEEIQDAIDAIDNAINGLTPDKSELEQKLTEGENTDTTGYTPNSVQDLENAIDDANDVINNPNATPEEISDAIQAIDDAINGLTPDKSELEDKIEEGNNTDTTGMTPESVQALEDAIDAAEDVLNDPDATVEEIQNAIDAIDNAINGLTPDKLELKEALAAAEAIDTTSLPQNLINTLNDAIDNGTDVDDDPDATVSEIRDAVDEIISAVDDILQNTIDNAKNGNINDLSDESRQSLEDVIENAEDVINNPDSTLQDKIDAINDIENVVNNAEMIKLIPTADGGIVIDRTSTEYYYMAGLDTNDTSFSSIKLKLENDDRQVIAFRGETQLGDSDLIGTGCVIKCVSVKDPSIVYEQATVILYGDINGDGLINATDYDAMLNESLFGIAIQGDLFRIAGDVNGDTVIDGFDMARVDLQISESRLIEQYIR